MPDNLKILLISSEAAPYAKTGGLADVAGALPKALLRSGCDVRIVLPLYKCVKAGPFKLEEIKKDVGLKSLGNLKPFGVYESSRGGVHAYFIRNDEFFDRDELYGPSGIDYPDSAERFGFFSKGALALIKSLDFKPHVIHCNDWQSALAPFYLKFRLNKDDFFSGIKTLYTIHNLAYQGQFSKKAMKALDIPGKFFNMHALEFYRKLNFMKSGILYSDAVSTVSKGYAKEILTKEYGCGLDGLLNKRGDHLFGITNGVDYGEWNPALDSLIAVKYDQGSIEKKLECKKALIARTGKNVDIKRPLIGVVTRYAYQKGVDLIADIMDEISGSGAFCVMLGKGEQKYEEMLSNLACRYPDNLSVNIMFDNKFAHEIEAGADIFLMPSRYEPCGLNQMYSLKYGTIPIVRATGGLDDVIIDYDKDREKGNGFKFGPASGEAFSDALKRCLKLYGQSDLWKALVKKAMKEDHSWEKSAGEYIKLYKSILSS